VRAGEEGEPLRRWLADVRRFPGVTELTLSRMDRVATGEQLAGLLGRPPHQSLVEDVYARTQGNAYLTTLLGRDLPPDARSLPAGLPADLRDAATRVWRGLSAPAQQLTQLLAIAGRPQRADQLAEVATATGVGGDVVPLLREAVDGAVLDIGSDGTYWFVHPLLAEVLEAGLLPEERATLHASFAAALEPVTDADEMSVEAAVDLADHHHRAGHEHEAYRWALVGAEAAERAGGATEMPRLLRRALKLWPQVPDPGLSKIDLLRRIQAAAERAGEQEEELAAVDDLLALVDRDAQPLVAAELLVHRDDLRWQTGRAPATVDDARAIVRLVADYPDSVECALAVAELAATEVWAGRPSGPARADEAIRLARACGSAKALARALTVKVISRVFAGDSGGLAEAQEAQTAAANARDFAEFTSAAVWAANCLDISSASRDVNEHLRRSREELTALGAPHRPHIARLSADEAFGLVLLGDWRTCVERLRVALGSTPGPRGDLVARVTAALLAVWQGRWAEAEAHLARAEELYTDRSRLLFYGLDAIRAELALAAGDTERAFAAAMAGVERGGHANLVERLVPLAARALADEAQALRDQGEDPAPAVARLDDLRSRYPAVLADTGPGPMYQVQVRAMQAWYDAEIQRGRADPAAAAWQHAAQACADGELAWDEAYAWWRTAEALAKDRATRDAAAAALRRAHELAMDLRAAPLLAEIAALAQGTRISLAAIDESRPAETAALPGLTPREREILAHIVAGRTYGEIARDLVLSEKTVSVHVSHMLHKTGTANRVELAQLARRVATSATD
jgi:DNA-binding CsgD family transcriptional regulator